MQVLERALLVDALERTDRVARDGHLVAADQRAVRGVTDADVRVLPGQHDLGDPQRPQPLVEIGAVEGAVAALLRHERSRTSTTSGSLTPIAGLLAKVTGLLTVFIFVVNGALGRPLLDALLFSLAIALRS